jgi:hypothetical protein
MKEFTEEDINDFINKLFDSANKATAGHLSEPENIDKEQEKSFEKQVEKLKTNIEKAREDKMKYIREQEFEKACIYRDVERETQEELQTELVKKLVYISNNIHKMGKPKANYIHLTNEYIQAEADERNISFEEMVEIIEKELSRFKK